VGFRKPDAGKLLLPEIRPRQGGHPPVPAVNPEPFNIGTRKAGPQHLAVVKGGAETVGVLEHAGDKPALPGVDAGKPRPLKPAAVKLAALEDNSREIRPPEAAPGKGDAFKLIFQDFRIPEIHPIIKLFRKHSPLRRG